MDKENNTALLGNTRTPRYPDSGWQEKVELMQNAAQVSDRLKEIKASLAADGKDTYPMNLLEIMQIAQLFDRIVENHERRNER